MDIPPRRRYPIFNSKLEQQKLQGFKSIEKNILRGEYKTIQSFEADVGLLLTSFSQAYETEKPEVKELVLQIKKLYKDAKQKAIQALDPFIVSRGTGNNNLIGQTRSSSANQSALPPFQVFDPSDCEEVVRCICGTFSEEGEMVQCETCLVWQHSDCMRYVDPGNMSQNKTRKGKPSKGKNATRIWSPKKVGQKSPQKKETTDFQLLSPPKRTISTDSDEKEKVEFGDGEVISVKEALPLLEAKDEEEEMDISLSEIETQVVNYDQVGSPSTPEPGKSETPYYCELCQPREIDPEVPMGGVNDTSEKTHYLTLVREDGLMVRRNDTVYVLREWPPDQRTNPDGTPKPRKTYLNAGPLVPSECDIFRIDSLCKDAM